MLTPTHHHLSSPLLLGLIALACGCGGGGARQKTGEFPTRAELAEITAMRPPAIKVTNDVNVGSWKLKGPMPDAIDDAPEDGSTPWGKAALDAAGERPGAFFSTKAMGCAAREAASFLLEHKRLPGRAASRFIAGRCGVPNSYMQTASVTASDVAAGKSDAEVFRGFRDDVARLVRDLGGNQSFLGVGFARSGDQAGMVVATTKRRTRLERTPLVQTEDTVTLRGEVLKPVKTLRALSTSGSFGFHECTEDSTVTLPRFAIQCPIAKTDASMTIEMVAFTPGRVLGETVLEVVVFPSAPSSAFTGTTTPDTTFSGDKPAIVNALTERVNAVRKDAGMVPLRLSPRQSAVADALAPYYFAATVGSFDPIIGDKVVLGLMAGWEVEGEVRKGHFSSGIYGHRDPARLLDELAQRPFGRQTLFDPAASTLAVGVLAPDNGALAAVIGTYSLFDPAAKPDDEMGQVIDRITRLRSAKQLAAPRLIAELDEEARRAAAKVKQGKAPQDAMKEMIQGSVGRMSSGGVRGWALSGSSVESLPLPSELLSWSNLPLALSVVHYQRPGYPWRELLVFVVAVQLEGPSTAAIKGPRRG